VVVGVNPHARGFHCSDQQIHEAAMQKWTTAIVFILGVLLEVLGHCADVPGDWYWGGNQPACSKGPLKRAKSGPEFP
jgi:hypothetical protein